LQIRDNIGQTTKALLDWKIEMFGQVWKDKTFWSI